MKKIIQFEVEVHKSDEDLEGENRSLLNAARSALSRAYAPYSDFQVAAAVRLSNGVIIEGTNQENAAYPSGLCAERVALFYAKSQYPNEQITSVAIVTNHEELSSPVAPCGACRQVILEYQMNQKDPLKFLLSARKGTVYTLSDARSLLPLHFSKEDLKKAP
jgi:cytidine deaminase